MNNDENTKVAVEMISKSTTLTGKLVNSFLDMGIKILSKENNKFKDQGVLTDKSPEGKQKIQSLVAKHKDSILSLDDNITKEQVKDYQKQFKKMGVDFSIMKNGKDDYSFFFVAKDAAIIEKGLKNVIEKKSADIDKVKSAITKKSEIAKESKIDLEDDPQKNKIEEIAKEDPEIIKSALDSISEEKEVDQTKEDVKENVSKEVDQTKEDVTPKIVIPLNKNDEVKTNVDDLSKENLKQQKIEELAKQDPEILKSALAISIANKTKNLNVEKPITTEKNITNTKEFSISKENSIDSNDKEIKTPENKLMDQYNSLTSKEQDLFKQINSAVTEKIDNFFSEKSTFKESNKLQKMSKEFEDKDIKKVTDMYKENVSLNAGDLSKEKINNNNLEEKLNQPIKSIEKETEKPKEKPKEKQNEVKKENKFSLNNLKKIDSELKEKEKFSDKNRKQELER